MCLQADCYKYFDSPTGHVEHWGDTAIGKCMLLHGTAMFVWACNTIIAEVFICPRAV